VTQEFGRHDPANQTGFTSTRIVIIEPAASSAEATTTTDESISPRSARMRPNEVID